jgi:hypothetical protein
MTIKTAVKNRQAPISPALGSCPFVAVHLTISLREQHDDHQFINT